MKRVLFFNLKAVCICSLFVFLQSCNSNSSEYQNFTPNEALENYYNTLLDSINFNVTQIDANYSLTEQKESFINARIQFKKVEPILEFIDAESYNYLNQPNILKVEEEDFTDIKIKKPTGFQALEEALFTENPDKAEILLHAKKISQRIIFLKKNKDFSFLKKHHILWLLRDGFLRVSLMGVTGFDSPVLEQSLIEAQAVYKSLGEIIAFYKPEFQSEQLYNDWQNHINKIILALKGSDFETFDRYDFIKNYTQKTLGIWNNTVADWKVDFPFENAIKNDANFLFSNETFNINFFTDQRDFPLQAKKVALGKTLFYDTSLSRNNTMSCATCHQPELYFTDGLAKSEGATRNSPTLLYAALQKGFFHDKRTGTLEGQIVDVVNNPNEFHLSLNELEVKVKSNSVYKKQFEKAYEKEINSQLIRNAIASYIMTLTPFNSKFDRNMKGIETSLTSNEINGFNLFMGKAKCATCHFAPLFNGLVPTRFKESEVELLGVPMKNDTINAIIDPDLGVYNIFQTEERKHFFKTSTIRNSAKTAPYMHNGVYTTLEEVIDFYDRGGGSGIGIHQEYQTLPSDRLNLTVEEKNDLIRFLESLTDKLK